MKSVEIKRIRFGIKLKRIVMEENKTKNVYQIFSVYFVLNKVSSVGKVTFSIIRVSFPIILTVLSMVFLVSSDSLSEKLRY